MCYNVKLECFLIPSMTESKCWSERRSKATKGGTLESKTAPFFNKLYYSCSIQEQPIFIEFGGPIQNPFQFPFEELTPQLLTVASRVGLLSQSPLYFHRHRVATRHTLGPSDSSKQIDVRIEKCLGSSDFSSDIDGLVKVFGLPIYWHCPASYPFPNFSAFRELLAIPSILFH